MQYERSFKRAASFPVINGKRTVAFAPAFSDAQLLQLGESIQAALGEGFIKFSALDGEQTHDIKIEWIELDREAELAAIDAAFAAWLGGQG